MPQPVHAEINGSERIPPHIELVPLDHRGHPQPGQVLLVRDSDSAEWRNPSKRMIEVVGAMISAACVICMMAFPLLGVPITTGYATIVVLATLTMGCTFVVAIL